MVEDSVAVSIGVAVDVAVVVSLCAHYRNISREMRNMKTYLK